MPVRQFKPVTKSSRFRSVPDFKEITRTEPEKSLLEPLKKSGGRDNHGHISMRRRGGGHKRMYRKIDFKRNRFGLTATVEHIEYDPNRSARIALVSYEDGEKRYIIHPRGLAVGDKIVSGPGSDIRIGNALPLREVPLGTDVHNVELLPGRGGQMARSAGTSLQVVAKEGEYVTLRMASTEMRLVHGNCLGTIGTVGNAEHELLSHGKAGHSRWKGRRPKVRGEVMNPVDHPHGGGEGKTAAGRHPVSPWGQQTKGKKTRRNKRTTSMIVSRRGKK